MWQGYSYVLHISRLHMLQRCCKRILGIFAFSEVKLLCHPLSTVALLYCLHEARLE